MIKIKQKWDDYIDELDERWRELPLKKQHQYTLYFFAVYLLLTIGIVLKVWHDTSTSGNTMVIEYIENPILNKGEATETLQDSISTHLKQKNYEIK